MKLKILLSIANIKTRTLNTLISYFGLLNRKLNGKLTKNQIYNKAFEEAIQKHPDKANELRRRQERYQQSAALGFTAGYVDRARLIAQEKEVIDTDIPTSIIYSSNDEFFANPKRNAECIGSTIAKKDYYEVDKGGHIGLVEYPQKYNPILINVFDKLWMKNPQE